MKKKNFRQIIPVNTPRITPSDRALVARCLRSGWISSQGPYLEEFEERWAAYCGRGFGVAVSSGTAALQLALAALDLKPGDEVIMPAFTIISCALAVVQNGGTPVLVDADAQTWCLDVSRLKDKITRRTRAILVVHIYGHPVDMKPVLNLAAKHGLTVIEDAAEAHGARYYFGGNGSKTAWQRCGSFGEVSCFSFYANKLITTGEGGMLLTNDEKKAKLYRSLRNLCFDPHRRFWHNRLGFNFRLTNLQAALGLSQLKRMQGIIERKRWIAGVYAERLQAFKILQLPVERPWARSVYWVYGVVVAAGSGLDAPALAARLQALGIETRPFFLGMHEQPVLQRMGLFRGERYPVTEKLTRQGLYLPSGLTLTLSEIDAVCFAVKEALA